MFKDILLAYRLYTFLPDQLPIALFTAIVTSILLGELANIITVLNYKEWSKVQKLLGVVFIFMVPAVISYEMFKLDYKL